MTAMTAKACPACNGQRTSKAHCKQRQCEWLECGCGHIWDLGTGRSFYRYGSPSGLLPKPRKDEP